MEIQYDALPTTPSLPNAVGNQHRPWRWERVYLAEKTCLHCGAIMRPKIYRHPDGSPKSCLAETEWNAIRYCSPKCGAQKRKKPPVYRPPQTPPWRSQRIQMAHKQCLCCGNTFRPRFTVAPDGTIQHAMKEYLWKRQRFCSISCAKKVENPMWIPQVKEKVCQTLKASGHGPVLRGGNGHLTEPQQLLLKRLKKDWYPEYVVVTDRPRPKGMPKNIKLDIANPHLQIAIEIDGNSHATISRRKADKRQMEFLLRKGWSVLRLSNAKALQLCSIYKSKDTLLTTLMGYLHITAT